MDSTKICISSLFTCKDFRQLVKRLRDSSLLFSFFFKSSFGGHLRMIWIITLKEKQLRFCTITDSKTFAGDVRDITKRVESLLKLRFSSRT
jgi:hypothetical protein